MQYLFNCWGSLKKRICKARQIILCTDFDGTIIPIKPRPKDANLSEDRRQILSKISKHHSFIVAIISGRGLKDLKQQVAIKGLIYAGNHGLEIAYKKKNFIFPAAKRHIPVIRRIGQKLRKQVASFPQAVLEEKRLSLSLHYRLVKKEDLRRLREIFLRVVKPYIATREIKLTFGKKVWEVRPPIDWDKGKALLWLVQRLKPKGALTIYIGDDVTDEDAFGAVNKIGGLSILVGRRRDSRAGYYLKSTKDTKKFFTKIRAIKV